MISLIYYTYFLYGVWLIKFLCKPYFLEERWEIEIWVEHLTVCVPLVLLRCTARIVPVVTPLIGGDYCYPGHAGFL